MERGQQEMEEHLEKLGDGIADAKSTAAQRQDAPEQARPADDSVGGGEDDDAERPEVEESATDDDATVRTVSEEHDADVSADSDDSEDEDDEDDDGDDPDVDIATPAT